MLRLEQNRTGKALNHYCHYDPSRISSPSNHIVFVLAGCVCVTFLKLFRGVYLKKVKKKEL